VKICTTKSFSARKDGGGFSKTLILIVRNKGEIMSTITFTSEQILTLLDLLNCAINEIHSEIVHTDNRCFRQELKDRKQIMLQIIQALEQVQAA